MVIQKIADQQFQAAQIPATATIEQALTHMSHEVAMVVDADNKLLGIVTDGDIRRAFLAGAQLDSPVAVAMTTEPYVVPPGLSHYQLRSIMLRKSIRHLPVVDADGKPVGLELLKFQFDERELGEAVIMAGGMGTRLRPLTLDTPKPLLRIGNETLLDNVLTGLKNNGVQDIVISVNYLGDQIKKHASHYHGHDVNLTYVEEPEQRGTAGALALLNPRPQRSFLVMNADLMTDLDFRCFSRFHRQQGCAMSVCVRRQAITVPYGVVELDAANQLVQAIVEKPDKDFLVSAGIYILEPHLIDLIPKDSFFDMPSLINAAIANGHKVAAFPVLEYWRDVGRHQEMQQAQQEWQQRQQRRKSNDTPAANNPQLILHEAIL